MAANDPRLDGALDFSLKSCLGGLGVFALFVLLRWNMPGVPLVRDEGEYLYAAQLLKHGLLPYEHSFLQKPPMVAYSYLLANSIAPGFCAAPRLLACAFEALATCLLGLIARFEFGRGFALPAMWVVTPLLLFPGLWQFTANTEMFLLLPLLATFAVYTRSRRRGGGSRFWFWAGALGATTLLYKYTAVPALAALFLVWSVEEWRVAKAHLFQRWGFAILGAVAAIVLETGPFLLRDGGRKLWECTIVFNSFYARSSEFGLSAIIANAESFLPDWWVIFVLPAMLVARLNARVWVWLFFFAASWASTGASPYGHYYLVVMPFWALLCALALRDLAIMAAGTIRKLRGSAPKPKFARLEDRLCLLLTAAAVTLLCLSDFPWVICGQERFAKAKAVGDQNPVLESPAVARRVAELTGVNDQVFVAGSEPQILCYAHRFSPSRFVNIYPLMIPSPLAAGYQAEAIRDLERSPPALIVFSRAAPSWLRQDGSPPDFLAYLEKLLADRYDRVGGWRADETAGHWQEPLNEEQVRDCSLVVFRRKNLPAGPRQAGPEAPK